MSIRAPYRYQLGEVRWSVLIYYIVCVAFWALLGMGISNIGAADGAVGRVSIMNFFSVSTVVFLFVVGLNTFKENFGLLMQNGVSRKTMFVSRAAVAGTLALGMATIDSILGVLMKLTFSALSPALVVSASAFDGLFPELAGPAAVAGRFVYAVLANYIALTIGFCITILFYRLNSIGKLIVGAGVPVMLLIVLPLVDEFLLHGAIDRNMELFGDAYRAFMAHNPLLQLLAQLGAGALYSLFAWLLLRRAIVRK